MPLPTYIYTLTQTLAEQQERTAVLINLGYRRYHVGGCDNDIYDEFEAVVWARDAADILTWGDRSFTHLNAPTAMRMAAYEMEDIVLWQP